MQDATEFRKSYLHRHGWLTDRLSLLSNHNFMVGRGARNGQREGVGAGVELPVRGIRSVYGHIVRAGLNPKELDVHSAPPRLVSSLRVGKGKAQGIWAGVAGELHANEFTPGIGHRVAIVL